VTEIKKLAGQVRKAFEKIAEKEQMGTDLCGLCARASVQLFLEARRKGIFIGLIAGKGHVYNVYKGHIVDITATQFGFEDKVRIVPSLAQERLQSSGAYGTNHGRIRSVKDLFRKSWSVPRETIKRDRTTVRQFVR
jgi:hypothetical protein